MDNIWTLLGGLCMQKLLSSLVLISMVVAGIMIAGIPTTNTQAQQPAQRCFPETGYCIEGRFRTYWEQNGGLPVFGYPITTAQQEVNPTDGKTYLTQWFERNRFEYHPDHAAPYDVLLGLLGAEQMNVQQHGISSFQVAEDTSRFFAETGYTIAPEFWDYWQSNGLELGHPSISRQESLALFGYPISQPQMELNPTDGKVYLTQWFERTRFEYHPESLQPVQLGLLGNETMSITDFFWFPTATPTPTDMPTPTRVSFLPTRVKDSSTRSNRPPPGVIPTPPPTIVITPTNPVEPGVPEPPDIIPGEQPKTETPSPTQTSSAIPARPTPAIAAPIVTAVITPSATEERTQGQEPSSTTTSTTLIPSMTASATPSSTTPTASATPSTTSTASATPSTTPIVSVTPTPSMTLTASATPSTTPTASATPSTTSTASATPSTTPIVSVTPTPSTTPTASATPSTTSTASATPSTTPTASATPSTTPTASATPSTIPTASATPNTP